MNHIEAARAAAYKPHAPTQDEVIAELRMQLLDSQVEIELLSSTLAWMTAERDSFKNIINAYEKAKP